MSTLKYIKLEKIFLKEHPLLNEKWLQERIAEDPSILGLGDLVLKDKERTQPRAGRLDLLLQDPESTRRYEVEVQLGATDEKHIIRTLEYWDIERKRYPQYEHTAVIVAEDITTRFLNVISLFNGSVPIVAIQLSALQTDNGVAILCTKVLDELQRGLIDEDEEVREVTDRQYWENRGSKESLVIVDGILQLIHRFSPKLTLKYNKFYIGLAENDKSNIFVIFRPTKIHCRMEFRLPLHEELTRSIEESELDVMDYDARWQRYRIRLQKNDLKQKSEFLEKLLKRAYEHSKS